jgi:hypothetical protein
MTTITKEKIQVKLEEKNKKQPVPYYPINEEL